MMKAISILSLFLWVFSTSLWGKEQTIGRVIRLKGSVIKVNLEGKESGLIKGGRLYEGDVIKTSNSSYIKILMKDDTIFQLGPNSEFSFDRFIFKSKKKRSGAYHLLKGSLRSLFTIPSPREPQIIKTPNVAMGVRGTDIVTDVVEQNGKFETQMILIEGRLNVSSLDTNGVAMQEFSLRAGESFTVSQINKQLQKNIRPVPKQILRQLQKPARDGGNPFINRSQRREGVRRSDVQSIPSAVPKNFHASDSQKTIEAYTDRQQGNIKRGVIQKNVAEGDKEMRQRLQDKLRDQQQKKIRKNLINDLQNKINSEQPGSGVNPAPGVPNNCTLGCQ